MLSKNEWSQLGSVIVGSALGAKIPPDELSVRSINYADRALDQPLPPAGFYPEQVIDQAQEDLDTFSNFLKSLGITVYRPDDSYEPNYYNFCPRDTVLVHDNKILAAPSPLRPRRDEYLAMVKVLSNFAAVTVAPRDHPDQLYRLDCVGNPDLFSLTEHSAAFDAANVLRANDDLFYLVSNSGNLKGAEYLQSQYPKHRVWPIQGIYSYMHLDSTIALLREGLMLLNPSRIKSLDQLPKPLQNWDYIWCPEPVDIGHYPGLCNSSAWVNMNLFSVSENLVVVEEHQTDLAKILQAHGIDSALLPMRQARTLGGCFHCVTLDLERL